MENNFDDVPQTQIWVKFPLEVNERISSLPEQEIAEPLFPRSSNEQVHFRSDFHALIIVDELLSDVPLQKNTNVRSDHVSSQENAKNALEYSNKAPGYPARACSWLPSTQKVCCPTVQPNE